MHILVAGIGGNRAAGHVGAQLLQRSHHGLVVLVGEQPGPVQRRGMSDRAVQVVQCQPPVEVSRDRQREHRIGGAPCEAATPQESFGVLCCWLIGYVCHAFIMAHLMIACHLSHAQRRLRRPRGTPPTPAH
ncbi:hypothetical protein SDC9_149453 [bioreactor metagenome]|uniref:Uncharacterized protein n=1 Tax=bioreactor metagenome TaxID=1076179 RepID=A0A645EM89_9ZZZZ